MADIDWKRLGKELRGRRVERGLRQQDVCEAINASSATLWRIEDGQIETREFGIVAAYARLVGHPLADAVPVHDPSHTPSA